MEDISPFILRQIIVFHIWELWQTYRLSVALQYRILRLPRRHTVDQKSVRAVSQILRRRVPRILAQGPSQRPLLKAPLLAQDPGPRPLLQAPLQVLILARRRLLQVP